MNQSRRDFLKLMGITGGAVVNGLIESTTHVESGALEGLKDIGDAMTTFFPPQIVNPDSIGVNPRQMVFSRIPVMKLVPHELAVKAVPGLAAPLLTPDETPFLDIFNELYPQAKLITPNLTILDVARLLDIPLEFLLAQIAQESSFNTNPYLCDSLFCTWGLMQLSPPAASYSQGVMKQFVDAMGPASTQRGEPSNTKTALTLIYQDIQKHPGSWRTNPVYNWVLGTFYFAAGRAYIDKTHRGLSREMILTLALARYNKGDLAEVALAICKQSTNDCRIDPKLINDWPTVASYLDAAAKKKGYTWGEMKDYAYYGKLYVDTIVKTATWYRKLFTDFSERKIDVNALKQGIMSGPPPPAKIKSEIRPRTIPRVFADQADGLTSGVWYNNLYVELVNR